MRRGFIGTYRNRTRSTFSPWRHSSIADWTRQPVRRALCDAERNAAFTLSCPIWVPKLSHYMFPYVMQTTGSLPSVAEQSLMNSILAALQKLPQPQDRGRCDVVFGKFSHSYLVPCLQQSLGSRAVAFSTGYLIPAVLALEQQLGVTFHKGALFHDTALAASEAGNEDLFDYLLAMTDEEEVRTGGGGHPRGTFNLQNRGMAAQVLAKRLQFACDFVNGVIAPGGITYTVGTGLAAITPTQLDGWRALLTAPHQFELWRVVHDLEVFAQPRFASYPVVLDNPFVMLRLAKALAHLAQLVESCLTEWQGGGHSSLSPKLRSDVNFGAAMIAAAGSWQTYVGNPPNLPPVAIQLPQLVQDVVANIGSQRHWRLLRILYLVRNSTAHTIDPTLPFYTNRVFALHLTQAVFVSWFTICQLKLRQMP